MTPTFNLDSRVLPTAWPATIRESSEAARGIRENVILKTIIEGMLIERSTGSTVGFTEHVAMEYLRRHLGEAGIARYRALDLATRASELEEIANGPAAFKVSPLTVGLSLTHDLGQVYAPAPHLRLVSDAIVDAFNGRGPRNILISLPSRYGKSETAGRRALEFFFANYPGYPAIYVTATDTLSETMGRLVRNDLSLFETKFGFQLADDSQASGRFNTSIEGGQLVATGIQGQLLGRGASICICDDFFKGSEQGNSASYRDSVWEIWQTSLQSRLQSGSVLVVIGTRFHSEDFHGRLLNGHGDVAPLDCRYIRLPALCEEAGPDEVGRFKGDALPLGPVTVPGFGYTKEELEARRASTGLEAWTTNYQQFPSDLTNANKAYRFDAAVHVRDTDLDPAREIRIGIDFNVSPMSVVIGQVREAVTDPLRRILTRERFYFVEIHDELSLEDSTTAEATEELVERLRKVVHSGRKLRLRVAGDASGNQRRTSSGSQGSTVPVTDWQIMTDGLNKYAHLFKTTFEVRASNPSVRDRVTRLNALLKPADGKTRFAVNPRCKVLIRDLQNVVWAKDASGNVRDTLSKRDPRLTHASDALGYLTWVIGDESFSGLVNSPFPW